MKQALEQRQITMIAIVAFCAVVFLMKVFWNVTRDDGHGQIAAYNEELAGATEKTVIKTLGKPSLQSEDNTEWLYYGLDWLKRRSSGNRPPAMAVQFDKGGRVVKVYAMED